MKIIRRGEIGSKVLVGLQRTIHRRILEDRKCLIRKIEVVEIRHVFREGNRCVDLLAYTGQLF